MLKTAASALVLLLAVQGAATAQTPANRTPAPAPAAAAAQGEDARLAAFFDEAFKAQTALSPQTLTQLGLKERYGELDDGTDAGARRGLDLYAAQVARMRKEFDPAKLSEASRLSFRLFEDGLEQAKIFYQWRKHFYSISTEGAAADGLAVFLINTHRVDTVSDADAYISRLKAAERVLTEAADDLDDRTAKGLIAPSFVYAPVKESTRNVITGAPFGPGPDSPVWADFKKKIGELKTDEATRARLLAEGEAALKGPFKRGYDRFEVAVEAMSKKPSGTDGVWRLPDGDAFYAATVKVFTTTDLTPEQIHQTGLSEMARIQAEMSLIKDKVGFKGTLRQFFDHIRNGDEFHYPSTPEGKQQFLDDAKAIVAGYMKDGAPRQFSTLPKGALEVKAVEPFREKTASVAFYNQGTPDGSRPAIYYVNLSDMSQVSKPQIEAITCHEGAPGHHFQLARSLEQKELPMFRRFAYYGAYIEGWGLYAEKLCKEVGGYKDPYADFGRLSLEGWRAARLVVDTGLHAKHWSRDQALQYFRDNTLLSERDVTKEVNRYIGNPGQATSYKIGQLRISALRAKAEKALGAKFDLKAFHEVVLANGALPLGVLEEQVDGYIAANR